MRPPEELDTIDWPSLGHAYGDGGDVPGWTRALYSDDREQARSTPTPTSSFRGSEAPTNAPGS
ncbi:hypothetical protein [Kitasatospora sp. NPDC051705]|uniref:hypothetical protein n=1 Tax=Kitasatospora sp. NPDC051705 TaxID=3364057 RepID=UPI0037A8BE1F